VGAEDNGGVLMEAVKRIVIVDKKCTAGKIVISILIVDDSIELLERFPKSFSAEPRKVYISPRQIVYFYEHPIHMQPEQAQKQDSGRIV
jgi:hypothetical protein